MTSDLYNLIAPRIMHGAGPVALHDNLTANWTRSYPIDAIDVCCGDRVVVRLSKPVA